MLKKVTLAVLGLAATGFAAAGTMGPVCAPGNVTVPCEAKRWDLGVQGLYMNSIHGSDRGYRFITGNRFENANDDWDWGYRLEGSYHFNTGNDITISWMHLLNHNSNDLSGVAPTTGSTVPYSLNNRDRFDQVNAVLGQFVDVSASKKMRFYAGLQYARIENDSTNRYALAIPQAQVTAVSLFDNSDFDGAGAVIGLDYAYNITNELSVTANGAGSILYGTGRYNAGVQLSPLEVTTQSVYASKKSIVPSLEAKLGVNYAYAMPQGILNFEGGYHVVNYFDALQSQAQSLTDVVSSVDYGLAGPYFGVKYIGNV